MLKELLLDDSLHFVGMHIDGMPMNAAFAIQIL
jgi:hypothetical protein